MRSIVEFRVPGAWEGATPLMLSVVTGGVASHSYFSDHPEEWEAIIGAIRDRLPGGLLSVLTGPDTPYAVDPRSDGTGVP